MEKRKGQDILIKAIMMLAPDQREQIEVSFIGRTLDEDFYQRQLLASANLKNIHWLGSLPHEQVWEQLAKSDVLVCSSRDETGPLVVYEAMALGKAVISTPVGAVSEIIQNGVNGMIFSMDEPHQLAAVLENFLLDGSLVEKIGINALKTYEMKLTRKTHMAKLYELINRSKA